MIFIVIVQDNEIEMQTNMTSISPLLFRPI